MLNWERERDGLAVVLAAGLLVLFADRLVGALVVAREWGPLVLGVGVLALAAALAYRSWARYAATGTGAAERQTALLERQTDLLAAGRAPQLAVESWRVEGDELAVDLTNVGTAAATDVTAAVALGDDVTARTRLDPGGDASRALGADEGARTYAAEPVFRGIVDGEDVVGVYSVVADALRAAGVDATTVTVAVEYADPTGERHARQVWESEAALGDTLAATVEDGRDAVAAEGLPPE